MMNQPNNAVRKSRWFRFSLPAMFVVVILVSIGGYWLSGELALRRERKAFDEALANYEAELTTTPQVCDASKKLFDVETSTVFADHRKAAVAHLERVKRIRLRVHLIAIEGYWPPNSWPERQRLMNEVDRYYSDAQRLASRYAPSD